MPTHWPRPATPSPNAGPSMPLPAWPSCARKTTPERALASLERAVMIDRTRKRSYQRIMMGQAMLGLRDAAHRTYQLLESRLAESDVEPEESTTRLLHQMLHGDGSWRRAVGSADQ
jgi:DNA-binding SARP family transcriptional activator